MSELKTELQKYIDCLDEYQIRLLISFLKTLLD